MNRRHFLRTCFGTLLGLGGAMALLRSGRSSVGSLSDRALLSLNTLQQRADRSYAGALAEQGTQQLAADLTRKGIVTQTGVDLAMLASQAKIDPIAEFEGEFYPVCELQLYALASRGSVLS